MEADSSGGAGRHHPEMAEDRRGANEPREWDRMRTSVVAKHACVGTGFLVLLLVGLAVFRDYGVSWDEPRQREIGGASAKYVAQTIAPWLLTKTIEEFSDLEDFSDNDYGVAFETPAFVVEQLLGLTDTRDVFMTRHLLVFLVFMGGVFALYRLASRRFDDWRIGLLAETCLVLSPRFFAEAFYNSKDIVFMAAFVIAMDAMVAFVMRPSIGTAILTAAATAFAVDVRIMAVILVAGSSALLLAKTARRDVSIPRALTLLPVVMGLTAALVVAMFPWLWRDPLGRFVEAFQNMSHFRWEADVRYLGEDVHSTHLPWHYPLVWIAITTPLPYLVLAGVGLVSVARRTIACRFRLWANDAEMQDLVFLALFCAPIVAVIAMRSVLYDGWRHLYFVYPALLLVATRGWTVLWEASRLNSIGRVCLGTVTILSLSQTTAWMFTAHPMQNVYFNALAGHDWRRTFELDYWGLGNRRAIEYILAHDTSPVVRIRAESWTPLENTVLILREEERRRVRLEGDEAVPRYLLTNYRGVKDIDEKRQAPGRELFYRLLVGDEVIVSVYKATRD